MRSDAFLDRSTGKPLPTDEVINSGLSVGIPGTPATWEKALKNWGTVPLAKALRPATRIARDGFVVNDEFRAQTEMNEKRFRDIKSTTDLFLPKGKLPVVGSRFRNPDLARTYQQLSREGVGALYHGDLGRDVVRTVQKPPMASGASHKARPGLMKAKDLADYKPLHRSRPGPRITGWTSTPWHRPRPAAPPWARR